MFQEDLLRMAYEDLNQQQNKTDKEEVKTMNRLLGLKILGVMLTAFLLAAVPARADDVDEQIKALKDEVARLENTQAQMKAEQMEMKREATEAATALPTFSYRPGNGLFIEAADKSWGFRTTIEANFRLEFESGLAEAGRETGSVFGRLPAMVYLLRRQLPLRNTGSVGPRWFWNR